MGTLLYFLLKLRAIFNPESEAQPQHKLHTLCTEMLFPQLQISEPKSVLKKSQQLMFSTAKTACKNDTFFQIHVMCLPHTLTHVCILISYLCIHQEVPHQHHGTFQRFLLTGQKGIFILIQGFRLVDNKMGDLVIQGMQWFNSCGDREGKQKPRMKPCWRKPT